MWQPPQLVAAAATFCAASAPQVRRKCAATAPQLRRNCAATSLHEYAQSLLSCGRPAGLGFLTVPRPTSSPETTGLYVFWLCSGILTFQWPISWLGIHNISATLLLVWHSQVTAPPRGARCRAHRTAHCIQHSHDKGLDESQGTELNWNKLNGTELK